MKAVIDTSSLLSLVRYYLPFDKENKLKTLLQIRIELGEIVVLDKVVEECRYVAGGIVIDQLPFLDAKLNQSRKNELFPNKAFFNMLENQFVNRAISGKLTESEYEARKKAWLESADAKILLYAYDQKRSGQSITVVTEESSAGNDEKAFKKIPAICKIIDVACITLPVLLENYNEIDVRY